MTTRIIAFVMLALVVGFIALLTSVTLFVRDPLPIVSPRSGPVMLETDVGTPRVQIAIDPGYRIELHLTALPVAPEAPRLSLRPESTGGQPITLDVETLNPSEIVAAGQLTQPGRWVLEVSIADVRLNQSFIVQE